MKKNTFKSMMEQTIASVLYQRGQILVCPLRKLARFHGSMKSAGGKAGAWSDRALALYFRGLMAPLARATAGPSRSQQVPHRLPRTAMRPWQLNRPRSGGRGSINCPTAGGVALLVGNASRPGQEGMLQPALCNHHHHTTNKLTDLWDCIGAAILAVAAPILLGVDFYIPAQ